VVQFLDLVATRPHIGGLVWLTLTRK